jgi:hypothetical protein
MLATLGACEPDELTTVGVDSETLAPVDPALQETVLAETVLELSHGVHRLTFLESDGGVAVVEIAPADAPPLLDALAAKGATALEILRAVSPGLDAPAALLRDHEAAAAIPARDLRGSIVSTADFDTYYYGTNCSYSSDHDYFRDTRVALGWGWRWYRYATLDGNYLQMSATTPARRKLRAHTCNNGSDWYNWGVQRLSSSNCSAGTMYWRGVAPGYRAVYYQTGASRKCQFYTYAVNSVEDVPHSLGIMTP